MKHKNIPKIGELYWLRLTVLTYPLNTIQSTGKELMGKRDEESDWIIPVIVMERNAFCSWKMTVLCRHGLVDIYPNSSEIETLTYPLYDLINLNET